MMGDISACHIADAEVSIIFWLGRHRSQGFAVTTFSVPTDTHATVILQFIY